MIKITHRKVSAFTLSEMLVVMLLTIIVVGLAFSMLGLVQRQMWGIQDNYETKTIENVLQQALWIDFGRHSQIQVTNGNSTLIMANELESTTYYFMKEYVLKDRDTFHTNLKVDKLYFRGDEVQGGIVDAIELAGVIEGKTKHFFIYKSNDAAIFMN
ncbi:PulJ/GspJ family protein [Flagellimonas nanhaiensis]|uniref:Prepilin-type N-terminal cleavage/methylation domain-containing protein n=1 Tax=Flagellimonas nanhaiensis TaxID=2292706 RepID=A0A371JSM3_9FLAO|nr:hypothetical protein [Allomuricauda nanhaiensis]RDY60786.1 hypothetical protein DX873_00980 [Allomuricauda nanhaiensis]